MGNETVAHLLGSLPIKRVLKAVADHQRLLEEVHQDARRLVLGGPATAYVVDFDLLHSFMWAEPSSNSAAATEAAYLFEHASNFILGPGTLLELEHSLHGLVGSALYEHDRFSMDPEIPVAAAVEMFVAEMQERLERVLSQVHIGEGIARLNDLLQGNRFTVYSRLASVVDLRAFDDARDELTKRRPGRREAPRNIADALNFAAVMHLRGVGGAFDPPLFPYLLTGTKVVLDIPPQAPADDDDDIDAPVARSTRSAIYGCLLMSKLAPQDAAEYSVRKSFDLAQVARDLRTTPMYYAPARHPGTLLPDPIVRQAAEVLSDSIIDELQRVLDNISISEGAAVQRGDVSLGGGRYLFNQVVQLARLLELGQPDDQFLDAAYTLDHHKFEDFEAVQVYGRQATSDRSDWTLECARYKPAGDRPFYVFRWPSRLDATRVCKAFSHSFIRHRYERCTVYVGTEDNRMAWDTMSLPFDWHEIADAFPSNPPRWLRASSEAFDLYADLWSPLAKDPMIGVFVEDPDPEHVAYVFQHTSSRFLFAGWARGLFARLVDMTS